MCMNSCANKCVIEGQMAAPGLAFVAAVAVRVFFIGLATAGRSISVPSCIYICACIYVWTRMCNACVHVDACLNI